MPTIPSTEPDSLYAGETWQWTKHLTDFSAATYTLKYVLQKPGSPLILITASARGIDFAVTNPAATTAAYLAGNYIWTSYAELALTRFIVETGPLTILPSVLQVLTPSPAAQILGLIRAALSNRIPNGLESTNIDGQMISRIPLAELSRMETKYEFKVAGENNRAAIAAGLPNKRNVYGRFSSVR